MVRTFDMFRCLCCVCVIGTKGLVSPTFRLTPHLCLSYILRRGGPLVHEDPLLTISLQVVYKILVKFLVVVVVKT